MVDDGEVEHLVPERVWAETRKALTEPHAVGVSRSACARAARCASCFPKSMRSTACRSAREFHPEIDTGMHIELVLDMAARLAPGDDLVGFCALTHDLGKALTPADMLPRHIGHEHAGVAPLRALASRACACRPSIAALAELVCRFHLDMHRAFELRAETLLDDARTHRRVSPTRAARTASCSRAKPTSADGSAPKTRSYPQAEYVRAAYTAAAAVDAARFVEQGLAAPRSAKRCARRARLRSRASTRASDARFSRSPAAGEGGFGNP